MFNFFRKPTINAKLINHNRESKVTLSNINRQQTIVLLFSIVRQVAGMLKMDYRQLCNHLLDLDTQMKKNEKNAAKELKRQENIAKHKKVEVKQG